MQLKNRHYFCGLVFMLKKSVLFLMLFFTSFFVNSQEMTIKGIVVDTNWATPVYGAKAYLIHLRDSVIIDYQNTNRSGEFQFNVPISNYRLFISHPHYSDKEYAFIGSKDNHFFDLKEIQLPDKSYELDEITIFAYQDPIYYKGDTLIYVADSFATKDNAVVEDLLKQLPGIEVEQDGSIKSNGKQIDKVYVDGDEFFGSDPTIATKNLAAKSIDRVQVYEADREDGSVSDEKLQILDLRLKENAKKGWFAKAIAATDFYQFGEGQLLFNRFKNKQKMFAFGLGSNTLNAAISRQDAQMAGVSGGVTSNSNNSGHPLTFKAGVFFSDQINKKTTFDGNYSFNDSRVKKENSNNTQYLLPDTTYFSELASTQKTERQTHDLSLNFNTKLDSTSTLRITPRFGINTNKSDVSKTTDYKDANEILNRTAKNKNTSNSNGLDASLALMYTKNFNKPKRRLNLNNNFTYNQNKGHNQLEYEDYFALTELTDNEIRQLKENKRMNIANTFSASYTEPIGLKWGLNFDYELYNNTNDKRQFSYNFDGNEYTILDSLTSNVYRTDKLQNKLGISASFNHLKQSFTIGVRGRNLLVDNVNQFTGNKIHQNITSALPFMNYRFKISPNSNFSTRFTTNSTLPSVDYLSPAVDNTNPNSILIGNESLKPNYNLNGNVNYSFFKPISGINFTLGLNARYTFNDFARSIEYDSLGRSISHYENIHTFNSWSANTQMTIPLFNKILRINPRLNYTNSHQNNIVNMVNNLTNTHNITPELRFIIQSDYVDFTTSLKMTEQIGKNNSNQFLNIRNTIWNFNNDLIIKLPWKIDINILGNYYNYSNLSQNFNTKFFLMNASISKRIGKYDEWTIAAEGYDLFNKNTQVDRIINLNTIVDSRSNIIARYFLLRITYSFNSTLQVKPKVKDENFKL